MIRVESSLNTKGSVFSFCQSTNSGRTLLEMLAVLAIVAILSVGAVAGFIYAMNKYRANVTIQDVSLMASTITTNADFEKATDEGIISVTELTMSRTGTGYPISATRVNADVFTVTVSDVPKRVCRHIIKGPNPSDFYIEVNRVSSKDVGTAVCTQEKNILDFYFDAYENQDSCGGQICVNGHVCDEETQACVCPSDRHDENGFCVCNDGMEECGGRCYNVCDVSKPGMDPFGKRDPVSCMCLCDEANGFVSSGEKCMCPMSFILVQNQCKEFGCRGGTPQSNDWTCYIGGERCGASCTELGSCVYGYCSNQCADENAFTYAPTMKYYGCKTDLNTICTRMGSSYQCDGPTGGVCGSACPSIDGVNCINGDCHDRCTAYNAEHGTSLEWGQASPYWGCYNPDNGFACSQSWGAYSCSKGDIELCAFKCDITGNNCQTNICDGTCPNNAVYSLIRNQARCTYPSGIYCTANSEACYFSTGKMCGSGCTGMDISLCQSGVCDETICSALGYTHTLQFGNRGGCTNPANGVTCVPVNGKFSCYTPDGALCGSSCTDLSAAGCPDCLNNFECPVGWTVTYAQNLGGIKENACTKDGIVCLEKSKICRLDQGDTCADGCTLDGNCTNGDCSAASAGCPAYMTFGWVVTAHTEQQYYGCIDFETGIKCYRRGSAYNCYTAATASCGTGCTVDGRSCAAGVCRCDEGYELVDGTCQPSSGLITCTGSQCFIGTNPCGAGCQEDGTLCDVGACTVQEAACPSGSRFGKVTNEFYGCINETSYVACYKYGTAYTCYYKGNQCGTGCHADGTGGTCDSGCRD